MTETTAPRGIVIQWAAGKHEKLLRLTESAHRAYCLKHQLDYRALYGVEHQVESRHPFWTKVYLIREALGENYDFVVWLDADALIVGDEDLRAAVSEGIGARWCVLDWEKISPLAYNHFNCGVLYLRNSPAVRDFVRRWLDTSDEGHPWADQHVFNQITSGTESPDEGLPLVGALDAKWHSIHPHFEAEGLPFVVAWHGYGTVEDRYRAMYEAMVKYGLGITIVRDWHAGTQNENQPTLPQAEGLGTDRHRWLLYGLVRWLRPRTVVEVGSWRGNTAIALATALKANGGGTLTCIDDFSLDNGSEQALRQNLQKAGVLDLVTILNGPSHQVNWPCPVDLAFIDGDHSYPACRRDVEHAIKSGARCLVLHDTSCWWGPRKLVEEMPDDPLLANFTEISVSYEGGLTVLLHKPERAPVEFTEAKYPGGAVPTFHADMPPAALYEEGRRRAAGHLYQGAIECYTAALAQDRDEPQILIDLADAQAKMGQHGAAAETLELAVAYQPTNGDAWRQLGGAYTYTGRHEEAGRALMQAVRLAPDNALARWNYALWLLAEGEWSIGWLEYQWGRVCGQRRVRTLQPEWDGTRMEPGQTLFVWAEQGLGDTIMMARFLRMAREVSGAQVIAEVQAPLVSLMADCPDATVFKQTIDGSVPYPWHQHISFMSLPRVLGITPANIPADPYFFSTPEPIAGDRLKVGVCRVGNPTHANDRQRSIPAAIFRELLNVPGVSWQTLQPEAGSRLFDFADTAARIAACDLVITVDTAVAHLAGAMGKPVWILLPRASDWRWLREQEDTPWYPTARLWRQQRQGDWPEVIARVQKALWHRVTWHSDTPGTPLDVTADLAERLAKDFAERLAAEEYTRMVAMGRPVNATWPKPDGTAQEQPNG